MGAPAKLSRWTGRAAVAGGVAALVVAGYLTWGTGFQESRSQDRLRSELALAAPAGGGVDDPAESPTVAAAPPAAAPAPVPVHVPAEGEALAELRIPKLGVSKVVVEGVSDPVLRLGPGHYPDTPLPGRPGNVAVAGHRTTYGAPFNRINELRPGDEIVLTTSTGRYRYLVTGQVIVTPEQVEVVRDQGDNRLTLTSCHPKGSNRKRIVVTAVLDAAGSDPLVSAPPAA